MCFTLYRKPPPRMIPSLKRFVLNCLCHISYVHSGSRIYLNVNSKRIHPHKQNTVYTSHIISHFLYHWALCLTSLCNFRCITTAPPFRHQRITLRGWMHYAPLQQGKSNHRRSGDALREVVWLWLAYWWMLEGTWYIKRQTAWTNLSQLLSIL